MKSFKTTLIAYLEALRFPWLLIITIVLFAVNVFVPDAFPFIDELLLALIAVILARLKRRPVPAEKASEEEPV